MPERMSEMSRFSKVSSIFGRDAFATMRYVTLLNVSDGRNHSLTAAKCYIVIDIISNMWFCNNFRCGKFVYKHILNYNEILFKKQEEPGKALLVG